MGNNLTQQIPSDFIDSKKQTADYKDKVGYAFVLGSTGEYATLVSSAGEAKAFGVLLSAQTKEVSGSETGINLPASFARAGSGAVVLAKPASATAIAVGDKVKTNANGEFVVAETVGDYYWGICTRPCTASEATAGGYFQMVLEGGYLGESGAAGTTASVEHYQATVTVLSSDKDYVLEAVTDTGSEQTITSFDGQPDITRNITATAGGTAGDIAAIQVVVTGTNYSDEAITETLPAFTENTAGTVVGDKAFKTVTSVTIPAHDGTGATTSLGLGDKLGLNDTLPRNTVQSAFLDNTLEGTAPTVVVDADDIEKNTVDLNSAQTAKQVDVYYFKD